MTQFKGFDLFNDIEDTQLRNRNRACVLANIAQDNCKNRLISPGGAGLILGYFKQVPELDRNEVKNKFMEFMTQKGFALVF